jgi:hypothetical protein
MSLDIGIVFSALGFLGTVVGAKATIEWRGSRNWIETTGHLVSVKERVEIQSDKRRVETQDLVYEYIVNSVTYHSSRVAFGPRIVQGFYTGEKVTLHYNPKNPSRAVLDKNLGFWPVAFICIGVPFFILGSIFIAKHFMK